MVIHQALAQSAHTALYTGAERSYFRPPSFRPVEIPPSRMLRVVAGLCQMRGALATQPCGDSQLPFEYPFGRVILHAGGGATMSPKGGRGLCRKHCKS